MTSHVHKRMYYMAKDQKNSRFQKVQNSLSGTKLILPITLGLLVIIYMLWKNFSYDDFLKLSWNYKTIFFILIAIFVYSIRHLAYSWRLRILCNDYFSWRKSVELIFIWEFASAISPTSIGGSATAMFFLAQEKLPGAKTVTVVLYTVILDTLFFLISLLILLFILGPKMIGPDLSYFNIRSGYGFSFALVFLIMSLYGSFFFYALFINTKQISKLLLFLAKRKWLKRFKDGLLHTSENIQKAALELKQKSAFFHLSAFTATTIAWIGKFATLPLIFYGVIQSLELNVHDFFILLARNESMFSITAFSPTPGGSGITEALFGGFFKDYIKQSNALIVVLIWRIITYYSYLVAGIFIIPIWIRNLLNRRKKKN